MQQNGAVADKPLVQSVSPRPGRLSYWMGRSESGFREGRASAYDVTKKAGDQPVSRENRKTAAINLIAADTAGSEVFVGTIMKTDVDRERGDQGQSILCT